MAFPRIRLYGVKYVKAEAFDALLEAAKEARLGLIADMVGLEQGGNETIPIPRHLAEVRLKRLGTAIKSAEKALEGK